MSQRSYNNFRMKPNEQTISNGAQIVLTTQSDNVFCDIENNDDDASNTNNSVNDQIGESLNESELNSFHLYDLQFIGRLVDEKITNMIDPQMGDNDNLGVRRPPSIPLKPIVTNIVADIKIQLNSEDITDGCFSREIDPLKSEMIEEFHSKGINVTFENLNYQKKHGFCWNRETKTILSGLNGEFRANELTAIMGPSGAGKSSLLDILSGYTDDYTSGIVKINGQPRDLKLFRSQSAYIMQDDLLQTHITVWESMYFSVNLKIGSQLKPSQKKERIQEILEAIGLYENRYTKTGDLSGGQKKRLAIALELVDNPQFMAFDEPTSGLDSSTSTQVVLLLKHLAQEGRTIVCTIHQPSAMLFGLFDHLYAMAEGKCLYSGATESLVPFLSELDLICPVTYNPSDYLLEISTHDYGPHNERLTEKIKNGLNADYRHRTEFTQQNQSLAIAARMMEQGIITPVKAPEFPPKLLKPSTPCSSLQQFKKPKITLLQINTNECCNRGTYATSFCRQFYILIIRKCLCLRRDRSLALTRLIIHICIGVLVGILYFNIGNDASMTLNNFRYIFMSIMFLMFTSFSTMTIAFPLDLPIVTREHFNRWYSIKAYFFAVTFADLPLQFVCVFIYVLITYLMTSQPMEIFRIVLFLLVVVLVTLVSQGWGMLVGAICGVNLGVVFGPFVIAPFLVFSGFFLRFSDAHESLHWLFHISYLKYALEGASTAIFGYNRPKLECNELYCHYQLPKKFMEDNDMLNSDMISIIVILLIICFLLRVCAFFIMSFRVKRRSSFFNLSIINS